MASDAETIVINGAYQHSGEGNRSGLPLSVSDMVAKLPDPDHIKMFVGQLPRNYTEEDVQKLFQEFGPIHQINMLKDKGSGQSKGKNSRNDRMKVFLWQARSFFLWSWMYPL